MEIFDEGPFRNRIIGQMELVLSSLITVKDKWFEIYYEAHSAGKVRLVFIWTPVQQNPHEETK